MAVNYSCFLEGFLLKADVEILSLNIEQGKA
jgi:hypothetical protein